MATSHDKTITAIPRTMTAVRHHTFGGPEVLQLEQGVPVPQPRSDQLLVRVTTTGVNYVDTYFREGIYATDLPAIPGREGAGQVVLCGADVDDANITTGDRVAFSDASGTYAEYCVVDAEKAVKIPAGMADDVAASILLQGNTAHALARDVYELDDTSICVITAGAGGVGQLLTSIAKHVGAKVISLVSTEKKEDIARALGADEVLNYNEYTAENIREIAAKLREESGVDGDSGALGVDVVYDGVGATTFRTSLECIRPRGLMCLFGAASGPVDPIDPQVLNQMGSIYLTRPSVNAWTSKPGEFAQRAEDVLRWVEEGVLAVDVGAKYPLENAAQAHSDLQARKTVGSVVLTQDS